MSISSSSSRVELCKFFKFLVEQSSLSSGQLRLILGAWLVMGIVAWLLMGAWLVMGMVASGACLSHSSGSQGDEEGTLSLFE
mmetsp:Transcript_29015/g.58917  ORF Transcript_29015/g.58917 Transcript_29015/m.58917 type:complete len:82 (-) Transcript_29015:140-385(-)